MPDTSTNRLEEAYALHLPRLRAIGAEKVVKPKLDIAAAGATLLGYLTRYQSLQPQLTELPKTNKTLIEELPSRAMAMVQAHANYVRDTAPTLPLPQLLERGTKVRLIMMESAPGLVVLDLLDGAAIDEIRKGSGYNDLAMDLLALAGLYRDAAPKTAGKTGVTSEFVNEAQDLGDKLLTAIGVKQAVSNETSEATQIRDRAYTHFMESYYEARRSLDYLLGDRDAVDEILPSIFNSKRSAKAQPAAGEGATPAPGGGGAPAPAPVGGGAEPADPDSPFVT